MDENTNVPEQGQAPQQEAPPTQDPAQNGETPAPETWDEWLALQGDDDRTVIETLYNAQTAGLKSALQKERDTNKDLTKQLKALSGKLEEGSEVRQQVEAMTGALEAAQSRADFFEMAASPEIGLVDAKAAWALMQADPDSYTHRGKPDFDALKEAHPHLFRQAPRTPQANAGSGAGQGASPQQFDMNDFIRAAAGRKS